MQHLQAGKDRAFDQIYARYSKKMLVYFFRMLNQNEAKAQDFTQDLFVKVIEKKALYNPERKFSTWLYAVASNMCKNEYRSTPVIELSTDDVRFHEKGDPFQEFKVEMDNEIIRASIGEALRGLDYAQRTAFVLRYREGLSIREISDVLECSEGTVKSRLFYTCRKLAKKLQEFGNDGENRRSKVGNNR